MAISLHNNRRPRLFALMAFFLAFAGSARADQGIKDFVNINQLVNNATMVGDLGCNGDFFSVDNTVSTVQTADAGPFKSVEMRNNPMDGLTVLTEAQADKIFADFKADPGLPFKYPEDGCYARAHFMAQSLEGQNVIVGKIFVFGDLNVPTAFNAACTVHWWYHVAPVMKVKTAKGVELRVLDPSILFHPASPEDWVKKQTDTKQAKVVYTQRFGYSPDTLDRHDWNDDDETSQQDTLNTYGSVALKRTLDKPGGIACKGRLSLRPYMSK